MERLNYEELRSEAVDSISNSRLMVLATCADSRVTARTMSVVNDGLKVLFQTDREFLKCEQIEKNPNVALCAGNMQIEGTATIACHPLEHEFFREVYKRHHRGSFEKYSHIKDNVVVEVEPAFITLWKYDADGQPFRDFLDVRNKNASREYYEKTRWGAPPRRNVQPGAPTPSESDDVQDKDYVSQKRTL